MADNYAFISQNYYPEIVGIGKYSQLFATKLSQEHEVYVVASNPYYPEWKLRTEKAIEKYIYRLERHPRLRLIRAPIYVPPKTSAVYRLIHLFSFALSATLAYLVICIMRRPKVTVLVVPNFFLTLPILIIGKLFGSKLIVHIQDLELNLMATVFKINNIQRIIDLIHKNIFSKFDRVITISQKMKEYVESLGINPHRIVIIRNPKDSIADLKVSTRAKSHEFLCIYSGTLGEKQGLETVIDAAKLLPDISFLISGEGHSKKRLQKKVDELKLTNVLFQNFVKEKELPELLDQADVLLLPQAPGIKDLVLPSKLANMLKAGKWIVVGCEEGTELFNLLVPHPDFARIYVPGNADHLARTIRVIRQTKQSANIDSQRVILNEIFDSDKVLSEFLEACRF